MWLDSLFASVFPTVETTSVSVLTFGLCMVVALGLGLVIALLYMHKTHYTKSFVVTLATLPAVVAMMILMVNGNIGTGVAVAGTFGLVRFRSVPGTAKEIGAIFLAMGVGLAMGMGYIGFAVLFTLLLSGVNYGLCASGFGASSNAQRMLSITIPEDLDYTGVFDGIFAQYTRTAELSRVKTIHMGSLLRLSYEVELLPNCSEKDMIDALRCRNGNLEIVLAKQGVMGTEL